MILELSDEDNCDDDCLYEFILKVSAEDLPEMDLLGSSDPYFLLYINGKKLYTSETVKDDVDPYWREIEVRYDKNAPKTMYIAGKLIAISGEDQEIEFVVMDYDKRSADDIIGKCKISWSKLKKRRNCNYEITKIQINNLLISEFLIYEKVL